MADDAVLGERIATELGGKTLRWWQDKIHAYMLRAKRAEDGLARAKQELAEAAAHQTASAERISELESRVHALEVELANANAEHDATKAQLAQVSSEMDLDLDAIFDRMKAPWERELNKMEKDLGL